MPTTTEKKIVGQEAVEQLVANVKAELDVKQNMLTEIQGRINTLSALPTVNYNDNGKFLRVVNGTWAAATVPNAEEASF